MEIDDPLEFEYVERSLPPECRLVLVLMTNRSEPTVMRKYAIGSWLTLDGREVWHVEGHGNDFQKWGWYLIAWAALPPVQDLPELEAAGEEG